uniref:Alkylated DNA repair protein AlkB homologue 8 N-terminal domain-containing protein n=1 Tax=Oryzias latipes TaxID=8090 RepID=A0A3P9J829_ORYLA
MLFIDFSSAFNTIILQQLICKLDKLGVNTPICNWLLDFLSQRPQTVRAGNNASNTIILNTGAPQGCVTKGDETHYREEVDLLTKWCRDNNLLLNDSKTKEIVVNFQRGHTPHLPLIIDGTAVERVSSTTFLGVHISEDLSWTAHTTSLAKKGQQRLYFLRKLKRSGASPAIMTTFYRGTIESIFSSCITVWGGSCTHSNRRALQRIVNTARRIIGAPLPSLQDLYITRLTRKALTMIKDAHHPAHNLFSLLPWGRRYRSLRSRTTRLRNSFTHQAIRMLNNLPPLHLPTTHLPP